MKERILEFLRAENKSSAQFAEEIGVQPSSVSHILSGRNNPSLDFILKMLEKYRYVAIEWLLFGRGSMYKDGRMQSLFDENYLDQTVNAGSEKAPEVPLLSGEPVPGTSGIKKTMPISSEVEKIVWFYRDRTFTEYVPGD